MADGPAQRNITHIVPSDVTWNINTSVCVCVALLLTDSSRKKNVGNDFYSCCEVESSDHNTPAGIKV